MCLEERQTVIAVQLYLQPHASKGLLTRGLVPTAVHIQRASSGGGSALVFWSRAVPCQREQHYKLLCVQRPKHQAVEAPLVRELPKGNKCKLIVRYASLQANKKNYIGHKVQIETHQSSVGVACLAHRQTGAPCVAHSQGEAPQDPTETVSLTLFDCH